MKPITLLFLLMFSTVSFAEIAIVVHPDNNNTLDPKLVARIFTGKLKSFPDGSLAVPIAQADGTSTTQEFNTKVLKKSGSQLKAYWSKLVFTGKGTPPKKVSSDAEMLELIASNPNFIGYVAAGSVGTGVKVITTL